MSGQLYIYKSHRFPTALPSPSRQWGQGWKKFYLLSFYWDFTLACIYPLEGANHFRFSSRSAPKTIEYDWIRILQRFPISDRVSRTWQWIEPKEPQRCNCETDKSKWNGPNGQIHDEAAGSLLRRIDEQQVIINEAGLHRLSDCLMKCLKCMKTFIASWIWFSWLVYELLIKKCKSRRKRCRWIGDYDTKGPPLGIHYANQNAQSRERNVKGKPRTKHTKCAVRADQSNSPNWCFGNYCSSVAPRPGHSSIYAS